VSNQVVGTKYIKRSCITTAFQMTRDIRIKLAPMIYMSKCDFLPEWVSRAIVVRTEITGATYITAYSRGRTTEVNDGDWIVLDNERKDVWVATDDIFNRVYEPLAEYMENMT